MRRISTTLLFALPLALLLGSRPAQALSPDAAKAEHTRLFEEMRKLATRNAWRGVEDKYTAMVALEKDGVVLSYDDHLMGAQAARELGRITDVYLRLERAKAQRTEKEVLEWILDIEASYGMVLLAKDEKYKGGTDMAPKEMPFAPDQRSAIGAAQLALSETGRFEGLLPYGSYTFGDRSFDVVQGQPRPQIILAPEGANERRVAAAPSGRRSGLRLSVGPGFTAIGSSVGGSATGWQPTEGRSGLGMRASLGGGLQLGTSPAGLLFEAGYHGMFASTVSGTGAGATTDFGAAPVTGDGTSSLNLFFLQAGPTLWVGRVELAAAVGWAIGGVSLVSPVSCLGSLEGGEPCPGGEGPPVEISGVLKAPGGKLGATFVPEALEFDIGRGTVGPGLGLQLGMWRDDARSYPWAQLALTITPSN